MTRDEVVAKLAQLLSGYGEDTWGRLSNKSKRTYFRAADSLLFYRKQALALISEVPDES